MASKLWVSPVEPKRKSCPVCKAKLGQGESVWRAFEYVRVKARNVIDRFCRQCWPTRIKTETCYDPAVHSIVTYHCRQPYWLFHPDACPWSKHELWVADHLSAMLGFPVELHRGQVVERGPLLTGTATYRVPNWQDNPLRDWVTDTDGVEADVLDVDGTDGVLSFRIETPVYC